MSYIYNNQVTFASPDVDSASRLRVSNPLTLFEHNNQYGTNVFKWDTSTSGTGTLTDPSSAGTSGATVLATGGTVSGASAVRQTRQHFRYQIGKSLFGGCSFVFGTGVTNVVKMVGYYNQLNGVYLQQNGTTINIGVRTNASGSEVDTLIPQSSWNVDQLNGSGPSGYTFNANDINDFRWEFFGTIGIKFYMYCNGTFQLIHTIQNASNNSFDAPVFLNLTIRQEIYNNGTAAATSSMSVYNANLMSEGADTVFPTYDFCAGNGITSIAVTTARPVLSIQAKTTGPNSARNYGSILPVSFWIYASGSAYIQLYINGTLTGPSWTSVAATSITNYDISSTAITGGAIIGAGYLGGVSAGPAGSAYVQVPAAQQFPLVYSALLNTQDTLSVVVTSFTGSISVNASINWSEIY
jgi:hypothetical protein